MHTGVSHVCSGGPAGLRYRRLDGGYDQYLCSMQLEYVRSIVRNDQGESKALHQFKIHMAAMGRVCCKILRQSYRKSLDRQV
jgi:hypothetical protein